MKLFKFSLIFLLLFIAFLLSCGGSGEDGDTMPDTTAPEWESGYPKAIDLDDRIYVKAALNENGHVYCILRRDGDPAPTIQDIADGQGEFAIDAEVSANNVTTLIYKNLGYSNAFDLYCAGTDNSDNMQTSAVKIGILTGARDTIFVSQTDGSDIYTGSISYPKKTISSALAYIITNFPDTMARKICVSQGTYDESVDLTEGISLLGGYSQTDWSERNIEDRSISKYSTIISGASGNSYVLSINGSNYSSGDWIVEGFTIETNDSTTSQGVSCDSDSPVRIHRNTIYGGFEADESTGIILTGDANTEISNNTIIGGISENGDTCGILVETAGDQLIKQNSIFGGDAYGNTSFGIKITHPVDYGTIIINNNIYAGVSNDTYGIYLTHNIDNETSTPLIYGNAVYGGTGVNVAAGITAIGSGDSRSISPVICNNVIGIGTGSDSYGIAMVLSGGHAHIYNNAIHGRTSYLCGVFVSSETGIESLASIINNIFINVSNAIVEYDDGICDVIKNNDFYNCTYLYDSPTYSQYNSVDDLNGTHEGISGNISIDAMLDEALNFTSLSPVSVIEGGLDLSAYLYFQENVSGQKIDLAGRIRTALWSIGMYEKD